MITIATRTSSASTRCSVSGARSSTTPPPNSNSVAQPTAMVSTTSGIRSAHHPSLGAFVRAPVSLPHGVGVAGIDEMHDQHVSFLIDVDRHLVGGLAGQDAPEGHGIPRAIAARHLDETRFAGTPQAE